MTEYLKFKEGAATTYRALADKSSRTPSPSGRTLHKGTELVVYNAQETPMYNFDHPNGINRWDFNAEDARNDERSYADMRAAQGKHTQLSMLHHRPAEFSSFFADPSMRIPAMTLAARALIDHPGIVAAESLSPYSSRLVHKGMELGVVEGHPDNPAAEVTNSIGMIDREIVRPPGGWSHANIIPDTDIREAKNFLRSRLRSQKEKPSNLNQHQFHQLSLFGESE